ncbi:MAG: hypothetical protein MJ060_03875 [Clostridia bacterium]|nr:hypothetical protein [Clostridia bacterium]
MKELCILTKLLEDKGYCVVGADTTTGELYRLVTGEDGTAVPKEVMDNKQIETLDVIRVNLTKHVPVNCQTENWMFDENSIVKFGSLGLNDVLRIHPANNSDFIFNNSKTELTADETNKLKHSVEIVEVSHVKLDTSVKGDGRNHHKIKFKYNGNEYALSLTDPKLRQENLDRFPLGKTAVVVSIPSHPYGENNSFHKFAAKVFVHL